MEEKEEWKQTQFEKYFISNYCNFRRLMNNGEWKYIKGTVNSKGYKMFWVPTDKIISGHVLVAQAFLGDRPEGLYVDHIDRNKSNNYASNLRYVTPSENQINSNQYRTDILETDSKKREKIRHSEANRKYRERIREEAGLPKRKFGGHIRKVYNKYIASIGINYKRYEKSFKTIEEAEEYLKDIVANK